MIVLSGYDSASKQLKKASWDEIGVLEPFDESSKLHDEMPNTIVEIQEELTPEVKITWSPPAKYFGCVSIQAKVYHPDVGWIEEDEALTQIICDERKTGKHFAVFFQCQF